MLASDSSTHAVVNAIKDKVQASGADALRLERFAKCEDKLARVAGDCFCRADRFGECAANLGLSARVVRAMMPAPAIRSTMPFSMASSPP